MEQGRIVERGTHAELLGAGGALCADVAAQQSGDEEREIVA